MSNRSISKPFKDDDNLHVFEVTLCLNNFLDINSHYKIKMDPEIKRLFEANVRVINISPAERLKPFIEQYPNEALIPQLYRLEQQYHYYRAIRGDGNCFYRACVLLYFREANLQNFEKTFKKINLSCVNFPIDFGGIDYDLILKYAWTMYLYPLRNKNKKDREQTLVKELNGSWALDAILIAYFRSINHAYIQANQDKFKDFVNGNISNQLQKVKTFNMESEGIQLYALAELLQVKIIIMMTHEQTLQKIQYYPSEKAVYFEFTLFYRPGHYDILYESSNNMTSMFSSKQTSYVSNQFNNNKYNRYENKPQSMDKLPLAKPSKKPSSNFEKAASNISVPYKDFEKTSETRSRQTKYDLSATRGALKHSQQNQHSKSQQEDEQSNSKFLTKIEKPNVIEKKKKAEKLFAEPNGKEVNIWRKIAEISVLAIIAAGLVYIYLNLQ